MTEQPELQINPEHLLTLFEITRVMNSSLEFEQVLNNVIDSMIHVTNAERGFLMIADDDTGEMRVHIARGMSGENLAEEDAASTSIVAHVAETRETMLTNNAQFDPSFSAGESIIIRGLRAILCAPMLVQERLIGVVYVDTSMRSGTFSNSDKDLLSAVAGQAGVALENARLYQVAVEKGRMQRELQMAAEIQEGLLPEAMPEVPGYDLAARWRAAKEVAGDFYDVFALDNNGRFGVVMADVSDKGAPAAMFMAVARTLIRTHARSGSGAVETLAQTNDLILDDAQNGMFVTVYHTVFEPDGTSINVNAGHNPPLLYRSATHEVSFMPQGGRAIGWFPNNPLEGVQLQLEPGDILVFYTDGLTEAENLQGDYFGEERLGQVVIEAANQPIEDIVDYIVSSVDTFCAGAPPFDDLTLFVVRYTG